jgi:hypothetical protein
MKNLNRIFILLLASLVMMPATGSVVLGLGISSGLAMLLPSVSGVLNSTIPVQDAQALFTNKLIAVYKEKISVMSFLRSFFTVEESMTKHVSIAVRRGTEKVAVDVSRYTDGNRNSIDKTSEKILVPAYYDEYITANEHELYDRVIASFAQGNTTFFSELSAELADEMMEIQKKIERAIEVQCAQIFETGIVELKTGNIDFKRKAASKVDKGAGNYWTTGSVNPYNDMEAGCTFIRTVGKGQGTVYNAILGSDALNGFLGNDIVKERADIRNFGLDSINSPLKDAEGGVFHGEVSCGSYRVRLWTYPEYRDVAGVSTPYINSKLAILLPEKPNFKLAFAAVPQLITNGGVPQKGAYLIQEFMDMRKTAHEVHIKSAPLAVPVAIDQIYTLQVVA